MAAISTRDLRAAAREAARVAPLTHETWAALKRGQAVTLGVAPEEYVRAMEDAMVKTGRDEPQLCHSLSGGRTVEYWRTSRAVRSLAKPWWPVLSGLGLDFWLAGMIHAHPGKGIYTHQQWHTDWTAREHGGPKGRPKISVFVYLTDVGPENGGTEFKRPGGKRASFTVSGPRGTVVAFMAHRVKHRGRVNTTRTMRTAAMFTFAEPAEFVPYGLDGKSVLPPVPAPVPAPATTPEAGVKRKRADEQVVEQRKMRRRV